MEFTAEEKKKLNAFLDDHEYLLEEGDYVTFLEEYREQNWYRRDALYYAFVELVEDSFNLDIGWFIKNDPNFRWFNYFEEGSGITHIDIPDGVTEVGDFAFSGCSFLTSIHIPDGVATIEHAALSGCSSLTSVYIPDSVTTIGPHAFQGCSNLKTVTFGENSQLTTIGNTAFSFCSSLTSINIPKGVTTIEHDAFYYCPNLTIYCEASSKPRGWSRSWNPSKCPVVWGYKKK